MSRSCIHWCAGISAMVMLALQAIGTIDKDADEMSDIWEGEYGFSTTGSATSNEDPGADPDGDGWTNLQESMAGTDPSSSEMPEGVLKTQIAQNPSLTGVFTVSWETTPGKYYTLWVSTELDIWTPVGTAMLGDGTPIEMAVSSSGSKLFWRTTAADQDSDGDGLSDFEEWLVGTDSHKTDTDGDGISDAGEFEQEKSPTDPNDTPTMEWFTFVGDKPMDELKTGTRVYTVKKGETKLFVVSSQSDEYPYYTGDLSVFNDTLEWKISPFSIPASGEDSMDTFNVNDRHVDWLADGAIGVELNGLPVHIETVKVIQAPVDSNVLVTVTLKATNVSDGILPSRLIVGILPADLDVGKIAHNSVSGELDESKEEPIGAFIPLNSDDDDYSATLSSLGGDKDQTGAINGENDLLPVYLRALPQLTGTKFLLDIPAHLRVWKSPNRQDEVSTTTEIDASLDNVVYVEGVNKASGMLELHLRFGGQDFANIARIRVSAFEMKGVLNVPGYSIYSYTADGSLPSSAKWITPTAGTLAAGSTASLARILWSEGPVVGKAVYEVNSDYMWDLEVNVVQVKLATGVSNNIIYGNNVVQDEQGLKINSAGSGKAMTANLNVANAIGPNVSGSTRGQGFIEIGFIQNAKMTRQHGLYDGLSPARRQRSSLEDGNFHIDLFTDPPLASTPPWYDSKNATGTAGFYKIPIGGATNLNFNISDRPFITATNLVTLTVEGVVDIADRFGVELDLNLYFSVRTVQDVNGSKDLFTQRGKASWEFDGSGNQMKRPNGRRPEVGTLAMLLL